jgi:hypothetical protein
LQFTNARLIFGGPTFICSESDVRLHNVREEALNIVQVYINLVYQTGAECFAAQKTITKDTVRKVGVTEPQLVPTFFAAFSAKVFELINGINVLNLFSVVVLCGLSWKAGTSKFQFLL